MTARALGNLSKSRNDQIKVCVIGPVSSWHPVISSVINNAKHTPIFHKFVNIHVPDHENNGIGLINLMNNSNRAGFELPENLHAYANLQQAVKDADLLFFITPVENLSEICEQLAGNVKSSAFAVSLRQDLRRNAYGYVEVVSETISNQIGIPCYTLVGYDQLKPKGNGMQQACLGCFHPTHKVILNDLLKSSDLIVNVVNDIAAVELCGALKKLLEITSGFCNGLLLDDTTKARIMLQGLTEMMIFFKSFHAEHDLVETFAQCGIPDLFDAADHTNNDMLAAESFAKSNKPLDQIEQELLKGQKLGGALTAESIHYILQFHSIENKFPVFSTIHRACANIQKPSAIVDISKVLENETQCANYKDDILKSVAANVSRQPTLNELVATELRQDLLYAKTASNKKLSAQQAKPSTMNSFISKQVSSLTCEDEKKMVNTKTFGKGIIKFAAGTTNTMSKKVEKKNREVKEISNNENLQTNELRTFDGEYTVPVIIHDKSGKVGGEAFCGAEINIRLREKEDKTNSTNKLNQLPTSNGIIGNGFRDKTFKKKLEISKSMNSPKNNGGLMETKYQLHQKRIESDPHNLEVTNTSSTNKLEQQPTSSGIIDNDTPDNKTSNKNLEMSKSMNSPKNNGGLMETKYQLHQKRIKPDLNKYEKASTSTSNKLEQLPATCSSTSNDSLDNKLFDKKLETVDLMNSPHDDNWLINTKKIMERNARAIAANYQLHQNRVNSSDLNKKAASTKSTNKLKGIDKTCAVAGTNTSNKLQQLPATSGVIDNDFRGSTRVNKNSEKPKLVNSPKNNGGLMATNYQLQQKGIESEPNKVEEASTNLTNKLKQPSSTNDYERLDKKFETLNSMNSSNVYDGLMETKKVIENSGTAIVANYQLHQNRVKTTDLNKGEEASTNSTNKLKQQPGTNSIRDDNSENLHLMNLSNDDGCLNDTEKIMENSGTATATNYHLPQERVASDPNKVEAVSTSLSNKLEQPASTTGTSVDNSLDYERFDKKLETLNLINPFNNDDDGLMETKKIFENSRTAIAAKYQLNQKRIESDIKVVSTNTSNKSEQLRTTSGIFNDNSLGNKKLSKELETANSMNSVNDDGWLMDAKKILENPNDYKKSNVKLISRWNKPTHPYTKNPMNESTATDKKLMSSGLVDLNMFKEMMEEYNQAVKKLEQKLENLNKKQIAKKMIKGSASVTLLTGVSGSGAKTAASTDKASVSVKESPTASKSETRLRRAFLSESKYEPRLPSKDVPAAGSQLAFESPALHGSAQGTALESSQANKALPLSTTRLTSATTPATLTKSTTAPIITTIVLDKLQPGSSTMQPIGKTFITKQLQQQQRTSSILKNKWMPNKKSIRSAAQTQTNRPLRLKQCCQPNANIQLPDIKYLHTGFSYKSSHPCQPNETNGIIRSDILSMLPRRRIQYIKFAVNMQKSEKEKLRFLHTAIKATRALMKYIRQ